MGVAIHTSIMEKSQITLTISEAKEIRNRLYETADDLLLLSQFSTMSQRVILRGQAYSLRRIAKSIETGISETITFNLEV